MSEYIGTVISQDTVTLLDINNTVPAHIYNNDIKGHYNYDQKETFMGFHCGNTAASKLTACSMKYQMIMARTLPEEVTQGTLEGDIIPGEITFYRLQSTADCKLRAYIAQGEVLPVATQSFGGIGIFAIPEMGRFYRHVLIEKNYPHHGAVAFGHLDVYKRQDGCRLCPYRIRQRKRKNKSDVSSCVEKCIASGSDLLGNDHSRHYCKQYYHRAGVYNSWYGKPADFIYFQPGLSGGSGNPGNYRSFGSNH